MKKEISILFILLILPSILAIDITLSKNNYNPQETLQAEITGSFISLDIENILIYEEQTPRSQPVISRLTKQGSIYYFYAILPSQQGNYSLRIEDSQYTESGQTKSDTIIKPFEIKQTNQSLLQINPGFVLTSDDFSLKVKALNNNQEITTTFNQESQSSSLIEEVEETLEFSIQGLAGKQDLVISSYTIPIFIIEKIEPIINQTNPLLNQSANQSTLTTNFSELSDTEIEDYISDLGETESLSCYDIGRFCLVNQECDGEKIASLEGSCCVGECIEEDEEGGSSWILTGILIFVFVAGIVGFIYWRSKKKQKPESPQNILKDKEKQFRERMQQKPSEEVSGNLGKI